MDPYSSKKDEIPHRDQNSGTGGTQCDDNDVGSVRGISGSAKVHHPDQPMMDNPLDFTTATEEKYVSKAKAASKQFFKEELDKRTNMRNAEAQNDLAESWLCCYRLCRASEAEMWCVTSAQGGSAGGLGWEPSEQKAGAP